MASYKAKNFVPKSDSCKGLSFDDWEALNRGESVDLKEVPPMAKEYLEQTKSTKKKETE